MKNIDTSDQINKFDIERILGDLPLDIIKENISTQINDPLGYQSDYCDEVYEAFDEAFDEVGHIDEFKHELDEERDKFTGFLLGEMENKLDLGMSVDSMSSSEIESLTRDCYNFFILNFRENINNFLLNYIESNKGTLSSMYETEFRRKDVVTMNNKKQLKNREDILILSNLPDIVSFILSQDIDNEDFLEYCAEPGEVMGENIKSANSSFILAGNFVNNILNEIRFSHNDDIDVIASNIKLSMMEDIMTNQEDLGEVIEECMNVQDYPDDSELL